MLSKILKAMGYVKHSDALFMTENAVIRLLTQGRKHGVVVRVYENDPKSFIELSKFIFPKHNSSDQRRLAQKIAANVQLGDK